MRSVARTVKDDSTRVGIKHPLFVVQYNQHKGVVNFSDQHT